MRGPPPPFFSIICSPTLAAKHELPEASLWCANLSIFFCLSPERVQRKFTSAFASELPAQLTVKTSSSKKRKLARPPAPTKQYLKHSSSPSPDTAWLANEPEADDDLALSFSIDSAPPDQDRNSWLRPDSLPAPGLPSRSPSRLQANAPAIVSPDYASSATSSSPCASDYAESSSLLLVDNEGGGGEAGVARNKGRSQSPFLASKRAIMNGDAELPHRSSSPRKRRLPSMHDAAPAEQGNMTDDGSRNAQDSSDLALPSSARAMSLDAPDVNGRQGSTHQPPPPLLEQIKIIETLLKAFAEAPVEEGTTAYLVSRTWVDKALALRNSADVDEVSLGPVDNSDIVQEVIQDSSGHEFVRLVPGSGLESFELFPEDAWKLVVEWYGVQQGQRAVIRTAVNTADSKQAPANIIFEFHPPVFLVHRLWSVVSTISIDQSLMAENPPPLVMARSSTAHAQTFLREIKRLAGIESSRRARIFSVPATFELPTQKPEPMSALTPPDSPGPAQVRPAAKSSIWPTLLVDIASFSQMSESAMSVPLVDHSFNEKFNGQSTLRHYDLATDQILILDEAVENAHVSTYTGRAKAAEKTVPSRAAASAVSSNLNSSRNNSPAPNGPMTRGRMQRKLYGRSIGSVGLHNLGNTCYMNSALQCVRSVEELTKYFLSETYMDEINKSNVLGFEGRVAMAYGSLLRDIYAEGRGSVTPRDFKSTVGRCRPTFSGWNQQDSQEFLGFLLDALQEDLSRIEKKPYIEKPDSTDDMINNPAAIQEMAAKVWDITCRRDDSVIADLFTGLYKSTLKCPECGKISITFDPFNNLTLPLPLENMWSKSVKFFPLNDTPVMLEVELPRHSSIESLKQFVSDRTGIPVNRLMGAEEFKDRFFKIYDNHQDVSEEIQSSDTPTIHELEAVPTNWPAKRPQKKYRSMLDVDTPLESAEWDDEDWDILVVPVLHRRPHVFGRGLEGVSPPHFITLTKEEASDFDVIQRKILQKVATFSTWSKLRDVSESDTSDGADGEMIVATASDEESLGDSKVAAHSVQGEDDMVDITMKDGGDVANARPVDPSTRSNILRHFVTEAPKWVNAQTFLTPELQNLFELCYFKNESDGPVPTGWSSVDNTRTLPKLSDRIPEPSVKDGDEPSPDSSNSAGSGNEESGEDDDATSETFNTRMVEDDGEDDGQKVAKLNGRLGRQGPRLGQGGRKKFKGYKSYGRKGNKRREKQARTNKLAAKASAVPAQPMPPAVADGGPLIRMFEGIVVDWNENAWDAAFGGTTQGPDASQGSRTFVDPETLHDPGLKLLQRRRVTRRTRGITLEECLDEFERAEILSEQDMWYCPRCKEHRRASKKFDLWKTPDILVAHLKRFSSSGWRRDKLDVLVDFPIEGLDLTSRVIQKEEDKAEIYDLIAVDDHYGGLGGGHYTAYAKNFIDGRWYNYNDSSVDVVSDPTSAVTSAAYLLFYRRRSSRPLGGPRFKDIFDKFDSERADKAAAELGEEATAHHLARTTITPLSGAEDDVLPAYAGHSIRRSIEDEGSSESRETKSLDMTQGWNFTGLDRELGDRFAEADGAASDETQYDSSGDDRGPVPSEGDAEMALAGPLEDSPSWDRREVVAVSVDGAGEVEARGGRGRGGDDVGVGGEGSDEVTEIRIESE